MANVQDLFDAGAAAYDRTRRQLLPCFDGFYGAVLRLMEQRRPDEVLQVLDLGAGTGLLTLHLAHAFPRARFTLVDVAERMLDVARERFADDADPDRFRFVLADYARIRLPREQDAVVSSLSIHHLEDGEKRELFARSRAALVPGGIFVNAEQVRGATPEAEDAYQRSWLASARASGIAAADLDAALERMRADRTATLADQLAWLREAGFRDVGCAFQAERFVVYSGRR